MADITVKVPPLALVRVPVTVPAPVISKLPPLAVMVLLLVNGRRWCRSR